MGPIPGFMVGRPRYCRALKVSSLQDLGFGLAGGLPSHLLLFAARAAVLLCFAQLRALRQPASAGPDRR